MDILHIASDFPYPPHHGARVDIWGRICALADLGHQLHLVATVRSNPSPADLKVVHGRVAQLDIVQRDSNLSGILTNRPVQVETRRNLRSLPLWPAYDLTVLEQEFTCPILENPNLRSRRVVLRVHNDEAAFFSDLRRSSPSVLKRAYYAVETGRFRKWSPRAFAGADELWFISHDHCRTWMEAHPADAHRAKWLPPPIIRTFPPARLSDGAQVLFVGNLLAPTNVQGIAWYISEVQPALRDLPGYRFVVAGSLLGGTLPSVLRRARDRGDCSLLTDAPDLTALYRDSTVFVNPMRRGASLKVKTVNAVEHGLPVVTTSVGNEGTGFQDKDHVLVADTPPMFAGAVRRLLQEPESRVSLVCSSQNFLRAHYDHGRQLRHLLSPEVQSVA